MNELRSVSTTRPNVTILRPDGSNVPVINWEAASLFGEFRPKISTGVGSGARENRRYDSAAAFYGRLLHGRVTAVLGHSFTSNVTPQSLYSWVDARNNTNSAVPSNRFTTRPGRDRRLGGSTHTGTDAVACCAVEGVVTEIA